MKAAGALPDVAHHDFDFGALGHAEYVFRQFVVHFAQKVHENVPVVVVGADARRGGEMPLGIPRHLALKGVSRECPASLPTC